MHPEKLIISVYKTSISAEDLEVLKPVLDNWKKIIKWTTDLEDWEKVLRIESYHSVEIELITKLHALNISCIELY